MAKKLSLGWCILTDKMLLKKSKSSSKYTTATSLQIIRFHLFCGTLLQYMYLLNMVEVTVTVQQYKEAYRTVIAYSGLSSISLNS